jgi:hypothetical protein
MYVLFLARHVVIFISYKLTALFVLNKYLKTKSMSIYKISNLIDIKFEYTKFSNDNR